MKQKSSLGKWIALALTSVLILSACSNESSHQDHSQHEVKQQKTEDQSQHQNHQSTEHSAHQDQEANVKTTWQTTIQQANQEGEIRIQIKDPSGKRVQDFKVNHEKKMHLIVVSEDLSYFNHLHPQWKGNGEFVVQTKLPRGGKYRFYADFIPQGGSQVTAMYDLIVQGAQDKKPVRVDQNWMKTVNGKEISLQFSNKIKANQETQLTFTIKDEKTKQPITDLEHYLGAVGHVVIISQDTEQYLHVHPVDEHATGPEAKFATTFPNKGIYKIWGQFQHQGKVITVPFVINVNAS